MNEIDAIQLNFEEHTLTIVNLSLSLIMFGIALNLTLDDFRKLFSFPKSFFVGIFSQLLVLPILTLVLILIFKPIPSMALGMILVASCPGGNISNFMSSLSESNVALSIGMTSVVSIAAVLITPLNLSVYGYIYPPTAEIMQRVSLDWLEITWTIFYIIIIPLLLGMYFRSKKRVLAQKLHHILKYVSILIFLAIVCLALYANKDNFMKYISLVFILVLIHNGIAILSGYNLGKLFKLPERDRRTIAIETGIQNSGLGLVLIFNFFNGLGGMAIVAAWWGIWHIISGLGIAFWWSKRKLN